jgi:hypothetical protein
MPLDLARLAAGVAHVSIPYAAETLEVDYRPELVTGRTFGLLAAAGRGGTIDLEALYAELGRLIAGWDLTDGGEPVPTDAAGLERLGMGLVGTILQAILADAAQNPTRAAVTRPTATAATSSGSSRTVDSALGPITTASSPPPSGPASTPPISPASPTPEAPFAGVPG